MKKKRKDNDYGAKVVTIIFALIVCLMLLNVIYIGATGKHFISGDDIAKYADERGGGIKTVTLTAKRGSIYSSDLEVIASDVTKYKLYAILSSTRVNADGTPAYVVDKEETAKKLSPIIKMDEKDVLEKLSKDNYQVEFGSYGNNLSSLIKDQIDELNLPGLEFEELKSRNYRYGDFASYQVGFVQNDEEKSMLVGAMGIEKTYNDMLSGTNGLRTYFVDNKNYMLPNGLINEELPVSGNDIYMTIDSDLQVELDLQLASLAKECETLKAAAAVMEAKTGRILAISNQPSYDPNEKDLDNYLDTFINEPLEPGSVFKSFIYANALNDNKLDLTKTYESGTYDYYARGRLVKTIKDHNAGKGWGTITYREGFHHSSNTAICRILTNFSNKESLLQDLNALGFFNTSVIDGMTSQSGVCGCIGDDKQLEYLTTGFGQGSTVTGLQLLRAYSAFANDGKTVEPYLVEKVVNPNTEEVIYQASPKYSNQIFSTETVNEMRDLLSGVVNIKGSTGTGYQMDDIHLIGKTGTAQMVIDGKYSSSYYSHLFCGLAPYDDPEIVICVWYQNDQDSTAKMKELVKSVTRLALSKLNEQPTIEVETSTYILDSYINQSVEYSKNILTKNQVDPIYIGNGKIVVDQYPRYHSEVSSHSRVFLKTNGTEIEMPSMIGWSRKEVEAFASMANVKVEFNGLGVVETQSKEKGTILTSDDIIILNAK